MVFEDKENVLPQKELQEDARSDLVAKVLAKGSHSKDFEALFEHDAKSLMHLSRDVATRMQLKRLEKDTEDLANTAYLKLRIWLAFANYVERESVASCVRLVYERMREEGIAKYYLELYESWAGFEIRAGSVENARKVLELAVHYKAVKPDAQEDIFKGWLQKNQMDADETIVFGSSSANVSNRSKHSSADGPTVVLRTGQPTARRKPMTSLNASKKVPSSVSMRLHTSSKLSKLGRAQRVVVNTDGQVEGEKDNEKVSNKERLRERIGDVSYIKNWNPEDPSSKPEDSNPERSKGKARTSADGDEGGEEVESSTITFRRSQGADQVLEDSPTATFYPDSLDSQSRKEKERDRRSRPNRDSKGSQSSDSDFTTETQAQTHTLGSTTARNQVHHHIHTNLQQQPQGAYQHAEVSVPPELQAFHESLISPKNIFMVNKRPYLRLAVIGRGGSSKVFKVLGVGEAEPQIYALKRIKLQRTDQASIASFLNEIHLLERLRGNPNIITLFDSQVNLDKRVIYMVMEHGEIDLSTMLQQQRKAAYSSPPAQTSSSSLGKIGRVGNLSINFIRLTWMNMLEAVHAIHEERIVHGDLKPANFLFVKGKLKLIDFGIAKAISNDTTNIMRDTQVGTLNYMSPEAIIDTNSAASGARPKIGAPGMKLKQGRASDIWSMGCILYQMIYGQTPFHDLKLIQKIHCISDPNYKIDFPPLHEPHPELLDVVKQCLQFRPADRPPIVSDRKRSGLLNHVFLNPTSGNHVSTIQGLSPGALRSKVERLVEQVMCHSTELKNLKAQSPARYDEIISTLAAGFATSEHPPPSSPLETSRSFSPSHVMETVKENAQEYETTETVEMEDSEPAYPPLVTARAVSSAAAKSQSHLPRTLQESILTGKANLKPLDQSSSSRFMRPQGSNSSGEKDLATLLREGLEKKRHVLESRDHTIEAIVRSGNTWEFLGE